MLNKLTRDNLMSLERYAEERPAFRARVMAHKKDRKVHLGPNATLYFEDALTMQYQVQEMLRAERIFEAAGIAEELEAYNPLIPDGDNWKATFMIEYADPEERARVLETLIGVEDKVWMRVGDHQPVFAIADEDLERESASKTSSVHFLRFQLTPEMVADAKAGTPIAAGIDFAGFEQRVDPLLEASRAALVADLA